MCIEKRPYTLYGRLATLHFRYLTCLLDRGHIKNGLFFDISLLLYGTFTNILCSFMGVYFDYKMPRTEITPNTLLHGNMSKIFVLVMIVALTILEMYFWKKLSFVKFSIGLSMMNILILLLIGVVMYMKRGLSDDRNK